MSDKKCDCKKCVLRGKMQDVCEDQDLGDVMGALLEMLTTIASKENILIKGSMNGVDFTMNENEEENPIKSFIEEAIKEQKAQVEEAMAVAEDMMGKVH